MDSDSDSNSDSNPDSDSNSDSNSSDIDYVNYYYLYTEGVLGEPKQRHYETL